MANTTTDISVQIDKKDKEETAKELKYMETHLDEYPSYDNREELKKALLSDD